MDSKNLILRPSLWRVGSDWGVWVSELTILAMSLTVFHLPKHKYSDPLTSNVLNTCELDSPLSLKEAKGESRVEIWGDGPC